VRTHSLETDPLGDNFTADVRHVRSLRSRRRSSPARARQYGIPTTIARLNVPYGDVGGRPWFHLKMMEAGTAIGPRPAELVQPDPPGRHHRRVPKLSTSRRCRPPS
jgi:hypothetical protein